ncbi:MAG: Ribosomal RNA small subunit methyltransferase I [Bacteroidetes bacterium ADurb.Bin408]|nr:MAG: Ribosomal RNA small subunit methyltransferase I [Bacteroidetes bacterium ADurb.Bin408]
MLVRACINQNIDVECLPGPTAFVPALVNSGLPTDSFIFEGFLPVKKGRQTKLKELSTCKHTCILYESPHRILKTLNELSTWLGKERRISVSREISKKFEETFRGSVAEASAYFASKAVKGEFVIVISGTDQVKN